jgi:hypothetical protein
MLTSFGLSLTVTRHRPSAKKYMVFAGEFCSIGQNEFWQITDGKSRRRTSDLHINKVVAHGNICFQERQDEIYHSMWLAPKEGHIWYHLFG